MRVIIAFTCSVIRTASSGMPDGVGIDPHRRARLDRRPLDLVFRLRRPVRRVALDFDREVRFALELPRLV
jgi:hypothetical protein